MIEINSGGGEMTMPRKTFSIDTEATDEDWDDFLADVAKDIEEESEKPDAIATKYPWFEFYPWTGDDS